MLRSKNSNQEGGSEWDGIMSAALNVFQQKQTLCDLPSVNQGYAKYEVVNVFEMYEPPIVALVISHGNSEESFQPNPASQTEENENQNYSLFLDENAIEQDKEVVSNDVEMERGCDSDNLMPSLPTPDPTIPLSKRKALCYSKSGSLLEGKKTRKSEVIPMKTIENDFSVQLLFKGVDANLEVNSKEENGITVDEILPNVEEPLYSTPSALLHDGEAKSVVKVNDASVLVHSWDKDSLQIGNILGADKPKKGKKRKASMVCHNFISIPKESPRKTKEDRKAATTKAITPKAAKTKKMKASKTITTTSTPTCAISSDTIFFYKCSICPYRSSSVVRYRSHIKVHEDGSDAFPCIDCGWLVLPKGFGRHQAQRHLVTKKKQKSTESGTRVP